MMCNNSHKIILNYITCRIAPTLGDTLTTYITMLVDDRGTYKHDKGYRGSD